VTESTVNRIDSCIMYDGDHMGLIIHIHWFGWWMISCWALANVQMVLVVRGFWCRWRKEGAVMRCWVWTLYALIDCHKYVAVVRLESVKCLNYIVTQSWYIYILEKVPACCEFYCVKNNYFNLIQMWAYKYRISFRSSSLNLSLCFLISVFFIQDD